MSKDVSTIINNYYNIDENSILNPNSYIDENVKINLRIASTYGKLCRYGFGVIEGNILSLIQNSSNKKELLEIVDSMIEKGYDSTSILKRRKNENK